MSKNKQERRGNGLDNLAQGIADAARVSVVNKAMVGWEPNNSILHPKPSEYMLAQLLGVDADWVTMFDGVFSGRAHGALLTGAEDTPAVILAQAMIVQRYGFIQDPTMNARPSPIHPVMKAHLEWFAREGYRQGSATEKLLPLNERRKNAICGCGAKKCSK